MKRKCKMLPQKPCLLILLFLFYFGLYAQDYDVVPGLSRDLLTIVFSQSVDIEQIEEIFMEYEWCVLTPQAFLGCLSGIYPTSEYPWLFSFDQDRVEEELGSLYVYDESLFPWQNIYHPFYISLSQKDFVSNVRFEQYRAFGQIGVVFEDDISESQVEDICATYSWCDLSLLWPFGSPHLYIFAMTFDEDVVASELGNYYMLLLALQDEHIVDYVESVVLFSLCEPPYPPNSMHDEVSINKVFLLGNYPNPFNPTTTISFELAKESPVSISIFNVKGQKVKTLVEGICSAGIHQIVWNGHDDRGKSVSSGVYFIKMQSNDYFRVKKMVMMK